MHPQPMAADEETRHPDVPADGQAPSAGTTPAQIGHGAHTPNRRNRRLSVPLDEQQRTRRAEYEEYILQHEKDEFQIGYYLQKILAEKLYRDETHRTIEAYGKDILQMSKRRIYELVQASEINENVRNSARIAPLNIEQALVLKSLPAELQQVAWHAAVEEHLTEKVPLTVKLVGKQICTVKTNEGLDNIEEHIFSDNIFIGIPNSLEIPMRKTFGRSRQQIIKSIQYRELNNRRRLYRYFRLRVPWYWSARILICWKLKSP